MDFDLDITSIPSQVLPSVGTTWFSGITITGNNEISFANADFTDLNKKTYQRGLTIEATVETNAQFPNAAQLQQLINSASITGTIDAVFPLEQGKAARYK